MEELRTHQITLVGPRVTLRPLTEDDWDVLLRWNNDPGVLYYSDGDEVEGHTLPEVQLIYRTVSQTALCFMIEVGGKPLGECWLQNINLDRLKALYPGQDCRRVDIMIGEKPAWGKGYSTEAVMLLLDLAFGREGADVACSCDVGSHNPRSLALFRKLGFEVVRTNVEPQGGKCALTYDLALTRERWLVGGTARKP